MGMRYIAIVLATLFFFVGTVDAKVSNPAIDAPLVTKAIQAEMSPGEALDRLVA